MLAALAVVVAAGTVGCKKSDGAATMDGGSSDGVGEAPLMQCAPVDGGPTPTLGDGGTVVGTDEFGPNAAIAKPASSLGRVNIYEITTPATLERLDIYLHSELPQTRLTIAIQEATSRTTPFTKLIDVQLDMATCEGWATSGPLQIPLKVGRFYAMGFDPNQPVMSFVSMDGESLPTDGMFGRLIGSRTATSVSVSSLTWEKFLDKEFNRQRVVTSPRAADPITPDAGAAADVPRAGDGGVGDANRG
ncbi:MAG: hypothetical protein ABI560_04465 [Myxococcales bacterium]